MLRKPVIHSVVSSIKINYSRLIHSFTNGSSRGTRVIDLAARDGELRVFMVAGEVSGDSIGSRLMSSLKKISPYPVRVDGVGGLYCSKGNLKSGFGFVDCWGYNCKGLDVQRWFPLSISDGGYCSDGNMGINTTSKQIKGRQIRLKETVQAALSFRPHVVVTIDSKGFSFRFLRQLKAIPTCNDDGPVHVHYVAPSFWAWKGGESRLKGLIDIVDHVLCVLPFEEETCISNGLTATYVGHPLLEDALVLKPEVNPLSDDGNLHKDSGVFLRKYGISHEASLITLLPGSRMQEVKRMLPLYMKAIEIIKDTSNAEIAVAIPVASNCDVKAYIEKEIQSSLFSESAILVSGGCMDQKYSAFCASHAALCTSGTAVMELQLAGVPCIVAYQAHILTEWIIKLKTKLQYISLPNIILNSPVIPEVLFRECTPKNLATALGKIMQDKDARELQISAARNMFNLLKSPLDRFFDKGLCYPSMIAASTILQAEKHQ